jgi:hypothetical protein
MEKQQLAQILESQRANFKLTLQQQENRSSQVINELRASTKGLYEGNPAFLEKLELLKHELSTNDFICSEEVYADIRLKKSQSLKEYIQCKVYEILQVKNR